MTGNALWLLLMFLLDITLAVVATLAREQHSSLRKSDVSQRRTTSTEPLTVPFTTSAFSFSSFSEKTDAPIGNCHFGSSSSSSSVDAQYTDDAMCQMVHPCHVGWTEPGEWLGYTFYTTGIDDITVLPDDSQAILIDIMVRVAGLSSSKTFQLEIFDENKGGPSQVYQAPGKGYQVFEHVVWRNVELNPVAEHTLYVRFITGQVNLCSVRVTLANNTAPFTVSADIQSIVETVTPWEVLQDASTPQAKALQWVGGSGEDYGSDEKVIQRYAVSVLLFAFHSDATESFYASLLSEDECDWSGVTCHLKTDNDTFAVVDKIIWANSSLSGEIPDEVGLLTNMMHLDLGENDIGGTIPDSLYSAVNLEYLYLHQNRLRGSISDDIANLTKLLSFYAGNNQLSGPFPKGLSSPGTRAADARPLRYISLHKNKISGSFPERMNLRKLFYLDVSYNEMSGVIPTDWPRDMVKLRSLYLDSNNFSGDLPEDFSEVGNGRLEQLYVANNNFTGRFPGNYRVRNFMTQLEIQNNGFTSIANDICDLSVWIRGEMVNFRADCEVCRCNFFCGRGRC